MTTRLRENNPLEKPCNACVLVCRTILLCLLLSCFAHCNVRAATNEMPAVPERVSVFEDPTAALTASQVFARLAHGQQGFLPATKERLNPGFSRSAWWIHLTVANRDDVESSLVLAFQDPRVDRADFYTFRNGTWTIEDGFPPATAAANAERPRYPLLNVNLEPHGELPVLVRITSRKPMRLAPAIFTWPAWHANEVRAALWDAGFLGGFLALAWCALLIGLFSRSSTFLLLTVVALGTALYEAGVRGYLRTFLWPGSPEWAARGETMAVYLAVASFILFILKISNGEKVRVPVRAVYLTIFALELVGAAGAAFGDLYVFVRFCAGLNVTFGLLNIVLALVLAKRRTPTGRLMLVTVVFAFFNYVIRILAGRDELPSALLWLHSDIYPNPVIAIIALATNLVVLAAWIHHVGRQRSEARQLLEHQQRTEQDRLRTEVAQRTRALNEALRQAEVNVQQKIEILGYVSHDLRAPLSTINGYAKLLQESATQNQAKLIQSIDRSVQYQLTLIDELLEFTKAELQPLDIDPHATDLPAFLGDIGSYAVALCAQQNNRFDYRVLTPLPKTVLIDGTRLQQVLLNLLSNAAKFTRNGNVSLFVDAYEEAGDYRIGIEVADTGIGFNVDGNADIFRAFQQVNPTDGGTGLGLFIAERIVKSMGGTLQVSSRPGAGTSFSFGIVARAVGTELVSPPHPDRSSAPAAVAAPVHVVNRSSHPDVEALDKLAAFARNGRFTDMEKWIEIHQARTDYADFIGEVRKRIDALDFQAVEMLVDELKRA
jgi:signal transduction histidine kinase